MRILFLTQVLPYPLDAGPKIRAYYTLRQLSERHETTLLSFVRETDSPSAIDHLRSFCSAVHTVPMVRSSHRDAQYLLRSLCGSLPFLIARDWVSEMDRRAAGLVSSGAYDAIHADQLWMAPYALRAKRSAPGGANIHLVLDQHNAVFQIPRRMKQHELNPLKRALLGLEAGKLARFESRTCRQFDQVVWVTSEDEQAVARIAGAAAPSRSHVIPICIDPRESKPIQRIRQARRVTFMGGLHWPPNAEGILWFARECWPLVLAQVPDAILTVIGKSPPAKLTRIAANCEVTGYVPDPSQLLGETAAFIVPLHAGGGMRVKIIEAWAARLPVVSTTIGAEGLAYSPGEQLLIADGARRFAAAVVRLLQDSATADTIADCGRCTAEKLYDWRIAYREWNRIYDR